MAPSPSRRRRRPTATSAAVAVAVAAALPELRLATVPLGKGFFGILRGFHWFQPIFFLQVGLSMEISAAKRAVNVAHWGPWKSHLSESPHPDFFRFSAASPGVQKSFYHQSHWSKVGIYQTSKSAKWIHFKTHFWTLLSTWFQAKAVPPPIFASNGAPNGATNGAQRRSDAALQLDRQLRGVETVSVPRHFWTVKVLEVSSILRWYRVDYISHYIIIKYLPLLLLSLV